MTEIRCSTQRCTKRINEHEFKPLFIETSGCWFWQGTLNRNGYGVLCHSLAHRLSWIFKNGPIPDGMNVLHKCDMPPCVNPQHLFLGTQIDNLADMRNKGRGAIPSPMVGESNPNALLTDQKVRRIRRLYSTGRYSQREVALIIETTRASVCDVVRRKSWAHVQ